MLYFCGYSNCKIRYSIFMKLVLKLLVVIVFITTSNNFFSQNTQGQEIKPVDHTFKRYDYDFIGELSIAQQEQLRSEVANLKFVTEVKVYCKSEKKTGMIRLLTNEYFIDEKSDFEFSIYNLKMLISKYNLTPVEYRSEIISK